MRCRTPFARPRTDAMPKAMTQQAATRLNDVLMFRARVMAASDAKTIEETVGASGAHRLAGQDELYPITSDETTITIEAFTGVIDDGRSIDFPAAVITGLTALTTYGVFYRSATNDYITAESPALDEMASPDNVFLPWTSTLDSGGAAPVGTPPPPGYGGYSPREILGNEPI